MIPGGRQPGLDGIVPPPSTPGRMPTSTVFANQATNKSARCANCCVDARGPEMHYIIKLVFRWREETFILYTHIHMCLRVETSHGRRRISNISHALQKAGSETRIPV